MKTSPLSNFVDMVKNSGITNCEALGKNAHRLVLVALWKTGLGNILNVSPKMTGSHMVIDFPKTGYKMPLSYTEQDNTIYGLVSGEEAFHTAELLAANQVVQIWMKDGWFNANAELLPSGETIELLRSSLPKDFFGILGASIRNGTQDQEVRLLRINKISPFTGAKGPGQYSWVWFALSVHLFLSLLARQVKRK